MLLQFIVDAYCGPVLLALNLPPQIILEFFKCLKNFFPPQIILEFFKCLKNFFIIGFKLCSIDTEQKGFCISSSNFG
jgi:hypothetical protein